MWAGRHQSQHIGDCQIARPDDRWRESDAGLALRIGIADAAEDRRRIGMLCGQMQLLCDLFLMPAVIRVQESKPCARSQGSAIIASQGSTAARAAANESDAALHPRHFHHRVWRRIVRSVIDDNDLIRHYRLTETTPDRRGDQRWSVLHRYHGRYAQICYSFFAVRQPEAARARTRPGTITRLVVAGSGCAPSAIALAISSSDSRAQAGR